MGTIDAMEIGVFTVIDPDPNGIETRKVLLRCARGHTKNPRFYDMVRKHNRLNCAKCDREILKETKDAKRAQRDALAAQLSCANAERKASREQRAAMAKQAPKSVGQAHDGMSGKFRSEYQCWRNIKRRCLSPDYPGYQNYGGRGIKMYGPWQNDFIAFLEYVGHKPHSGVSLDRIDNEGDYAPGNLRWATPRVQNNNKRAPFRMIDLDPSIGYLDTSPMHYCF